MGRRQLQIWGAPQLLVVMKWFSGKVAIQIPFLQVQMESWPGAIWAWCQFVCASCIHWWRGVAVSIDICFTGVVSCCGGRRSKLFLAIEALWVNVDSFEHVHKLVRRCLLGLGVFTLATDPRKGWHSEYEAEDTHHSNTYWHCHCGGGKNEGKDSGGVGGQMEKNNSAK